MLTLVLASSAFAPSPRAVALLRVEMASSPATEIVMADAMPKWKVWKRWNRGTIEALAAQDERALAMEGRITSLEELVKTMQGQIDDLETARLAAPESQQEASAAPGGSNGGSLAELIARADELHAASEVDALFELLEGADAADDELAWRMARAYHDKAEDSAEVAGNAALKEKLLREGLALAEAAKDASGSGYSLKWYAILLGRLGDFLPTKEKVGNSYKIKESLERAAALLPEDASVQTALGQWCYKVASISWVERNVAKALFGEPPESSYEEALAFVTKSHEIRASKKAALFAGLCHSKLKAKAEAAEWLERCLGLESAGASDREIDAQAKAELAKVK